MKESRHTKNNIFNIKCECTIFHNDLQLNTKKKSKFSTIQVHASRNILIVIPKSESILYELQISRLRVIHKKFIDEGKITLQFDGVITKDIKSLNHTNMYQLDKSLTRTSGHYQSSQQSELLQEKYLDGNSQIFINNGSKENLQLLIKILVEEKKKKAEESKEQLQKSAKKKENEKIPSKQSTKQQKPRKKAQPSIHVPRQQEKVLSRKDMINMVRLSQNPKLREANDKLKAEQIIKKNAKKQHIPQITLLSLPKFLLNEILLFSGISLSYRLISKQLEKFILMNIKYIKLQDEIEEEAFNKLAKYALNVSCRMKNVKNLKLEDRYDNQQLLPQRAKCLDFGNWKQIGARNINQLKGLRIYSLSVPYSIKFDFNHFYGLRMVELRLKGNNVTNRNNYIKDQQLLYLINNIDDLKVLQIPYGSTKILSQIKKPQKINMLKIDTLNIIDSADKWCDLKKFTNLTVFRVSQFLKNGLKDSSMILNIQWPQMIRDLQLGFILTNQSLNKIPLSIINLRLVGDHFYNTNFDQFYLPSMNYLDISQAPNITPQCLQAFVNLRVLSSWDRSKVDYANNYYENQNIKIASTKCYTPYN